MARSCAKCGKTSMGGFNPQSSGMNRVRAKRRYNVNLQQLKVYEGGQTITVAADLHQIPLFKRVGAKIDLGDLNQEWQEAQAAAVPFSSVL